jgi:two-component system, chemotaxis family, protein-glutamate methylesterase/glutaminase
MAIKGRDIIVIGTSAGGLEALTELVTNLPPNLPASIFIVQHLPPQSSGEVLCEQLKKLKKFKCVLAKNGQRFLRGSIYVAPPDAHLLLKEHQMLVTKGARENRYRPAIDPLFRSAALAHGPRVIGVVLTGLLDDGTVGLLAIKRCGGLTAVQDPKTAAYSDMPQSAINNAHVDFCGPLGEIGRFLEIHTQKSRGRKRAIPDDIRTESLIAERVLSDVTQVNGLGTQVPYNCPNCGGVLWAMGRSRAQRYRCHTGHSYTAAALMTSQSERIEETLWIGLRMFEERKNLLNNTAQQEKRPQMKRWYQKQAKDTNVHIERIRAMLQSSQSIQSGMGLHLKDD